MQPRLRQRAVDHLEQRPRRALGQPRIAVGIYAGSRGDRVADQPSRRRKQDVRADAVTASGRGSERGGQALGEPALHPAGRHRHDLGRERIIERRSQQLAERVGKSICTFGSVDVEHAYLIPLSSSPPCPSLHYEKPSATEGDRRGLRVARRCVDGLSPSPSTHRPARPKASVPAPPARIPCPLVSRIGHPSRNL